MKRAPQILVLIVIAICAVFFACSGDNDGNATTSSSSNGGSECDSGSCGTDDSSNSNNNNNPGDFNSSSSFDDSGEPGDSSDSGNSDESSSSENTNTESSSSSSANGAANNSSSSQGQNSSNSSSSSLRTFSSSSSHTPSVDDPGANCNYQPIWCGGMSFSQVKTATMDEADVGATDKGQDRPNCIYATVITQIGNESAGISINGKQFASGSASRCGGGEWGDATACATKFSSVAKVDGGYYIYIPEWAGQKFQTTGGQPSCPSTPTPGTSSSSKASSSSAANSNTGTCVEPMNGLPPNGTKSCIIVNNKCYTCNPDRGNECSQGWIWQGGNVSDQYWYKEVSCSENNGGNPTYNLTCTGLASTGIAGSTITQPTVKCNGDNATANFASAPTWNSPTTGTYNVSATANCGGNKTVSCGTIVISAAPSTDQLTCTGLAQTGIAGTAVTQPTVKCGNSTVSNPTFTGGPTWNNPTANTYTVSANATGACTQAASCGTIKISPKLTCGNPSPQTVTAGIAVTAPTVQCGNTTIATANVSWSGAPDYWSGPASGTYNNIKATVNSGDCSGQTANCGTLTVGNKLTCGNIAQSITTGQTPTKPSVTCGSTAVTNGITWNPNSINSAITQAGTISNITATASCDGSNQTATCTGSITVTAQQTTPSSSSGGGNGNPSYTPTTPGNETAKTTQYWDACKPSCGWSGKPGVRASSCNITGGGKGKNDERSACDSGGNSFTCMDQAPWKVGNVSFGYAAIPMGQCGDCYQLDFPNGHVMVVMNSNTGNLNEGAKFDIMIPGGGAGDFDALTRQVQNSGVSNPDMGSRYGGFRLACNNSASCVKQKCDATFKNLPDLRAGCNWYADNLGTSAQSFDNPTVKYKKVTCPSELTSKY